MEITLVWSWLKMMLMFDKSRMMQRKQQCDTWSTEMRGSCWKKKGQAN